MNNTDLLELRKKQNELHLQITQIKNEMVILNHFLDSLLSEYSEISTILNENEEMELYDLVSSAS